MISEINRDVVAAYGSLDEPDWSFAAKRLKAGFHGGFIKELSELGSVQDTTDPNDDVSTCLFIDAGDKALTLRLSLVGKYACVHDVNGQVLSNRDVVACRLGTRLLHLLSSRNVKLLDEEELREELDFGHERRYLYEVLFSSDGLIG